MKKRMLSILLALSLLLGMAPVHAEAASENGTAAVETEYLLHTAGAEREAEWVIDDQNALQNMGHGAYKLGADIELHEWTAIDFSGTLDGDGHTITLAGQPLFNELSGNVQNLLLDGAVEVENAAGALAFAIDGGVVNNCWSGVETFSYNVSAGFAGTMTGGTIKNCLFTYDIAEYGIATESDGASRIGVNPKFRVNTI